jgi:gluconolactonase
MRVRATLPFTWIMAVTLLPAALSPSAQTTSPQPPPGPDSQVQPGTPAGDVIKGEFDRSAIYPGTWREYWVYIPRQLDRAKAAPVMVFQDGLQYNAPVVFDNLIHKQDVPPIIEGGLACRSRATPIDNTVERLKRTG